MTGPLRPAGVLRQALREGRYSEVRDEIRGHNPVGVEYQKCLCDALAQLRDWTGAIEVATANLGADPYFSPLLLAKFTQNDQQFDRAWHWLEQTREEQGENLGYLTTASKVAYGEGDLCRAIGFGQRLLESKDQALGPVVPIEPIRGGTHKVLSFSLFGQGEIYLLGALANARLWAKMMPDWVRRFYVAPDVPGGVREALKQLDAEVIAHDDPNVPAYMARFLPMQDPTIAKFACRDVDCRPTQREVEILREWETSPCDFHLIRNHPLHTDLVLAGLWGGVPLKGFDLAHEILVCFPKGASNKYGLDQIFLERRIWPRIKRSVLAYDTHYRLEGHETRPVGDDNLGGGHQSLPHVRKEMERLGIRIARRPAP